MIQGLSDVLLGKPPCRTGILVRPIVWLVLREVLPGHMGTVLEILLVPVR